MNESETSIPVSPDQLQQARARLAEALERDDASAAVAVLLELHPADQAEVLGSVDRGWQQKILVAMSPQDGARVLEHVPPEDLASVLGEVEAPVLSTILDEARPEVAADILQQLPDEQSRATLEEMEAAQAQAVLPLLEYSGESVGGVMTPSPLAVRMDVTAGNALDRLRLLEPEGADVDSIFVVGSDERLVGVLKLSRLALARPGSLVQHLMDTDVVSVTAETDREECARLMERYALRSLPVVDDGGRLVGVMQVEHQVEVLEAAATEDMFMMAGIAGERVFGSFGTSVRRRLPWLYVNLATTLLPALVISLFEPTIVRVVAVVMFLPVVAGQGGIGGTQTLTLVIRSMALGDVPGHLGMQLIAREVLLGVVHGLLLGVAIGVIAFFWKGMPVLGAVVALAMVVNMLVAGLTGAAVPLVMRRLRMDPAIGSAVVVTTFTDVLGFLALLGAAAASIRFLT